MATKPKMIGMENGIRNDIEALDDKELAGLRDGTIFAKFKGITDEAEILENKNEVLNGVIER